MATNDSKALSHTLFSWQIALIALAALARFIPHPPNFTPIGALALFSGAFLFQRDRKLSFLIPLATLFLSDLVLGLHSTMPFTYGAFALIVILGKFASTGRSSNLRLAGLSLAASSIFFVVSNFGVWLLGYPRSFAGLTACFVAAIPFFGNTLAGDLFFSFALFTAFEFARRRAVRMQASFSNEV